LIVVGAGIAAHQYLGRRLNINRPHEFQGAEFIAVRVAQIGEIDAALGAVIADARRVFDRNAAICEAGRVPFIALFGAFDGKADGDAVAGVRRFFIERFPDDKKHTIPLPEPAIAIRILPARRAAERIEQRVIEALRARDVAAF